MSWSTDNDNNYYQELIKRVGGYKVNKAVFGDTKYQHKIQAYKFQISGVSTLTMENPVAIILL